MKKKPSKEEIEKTVGELFKTRFKEGGENSITHYEWEEDGEKYSSWKIIVDGVAIHTGDGGMEMFEKALKKKAGL